VITRAQIYGNEASEILRVVSTYKTLDGRQIYALFPEKPDIVKILLSRLLQQKRLFLRFAKGNRRYSIDASTANKPDFGMIAAFWVLLDFIDKVEYHIAGEFPVKISFFANGGLYEIIHVAYGDESLINDILSEREKSGDAAQRIILIEEPNQIEKIDIPNTAGYCSVDADGKVNYYDKLR
jgi:hypothetical protein